MKQNAYYNYKKLFLFRKLVFSWGLGYVSWLGEMCEQV